MAKKGKKASDTIKSRAMRLVKTYLDAGNSVNKSCTLAGKAVNFRPNTITRWYKEQGQDTPKVTTNKTNHSFISSVNVRSTTGAVVKLTADDISNIARLAGQIH